MRIVNSRQVNSDRGNDYFVFIVNYVYYVYVQELGYFS